MRFPWSSGKKQHPGSEKQALLTLEPLEIRTLPAVAVAALLTNVQVNAGINHTPAVTHPSVGVAADGSFDVAFEQGSPTAGLNNVYVRRFNTDNTVKATNGTILVASGASAATDLARIAVRADGSFVVAYVFAANGNQTVSVNLYNASGNMVGNTITPSPASGHDQTEPAVAVRNSDGAFVVTWTEAGATEKDVLGRGFEAAGNPLGAVFTVAQAGGMDSFAPSVAVRQGMVPAGETALVVSYTQTVAQGTNRVFFRLFTDLNGAAAGPAVRANATATGSQQQDTVAMNSAGTFVVTWNDVNGMNSNIDFRVFDKAGTAQTATDQVVGNIGALFTTAGRQDSPAVALADNGQFLIAFIEKGYTGSGNTPHAMFQQFKGNGRPVSAERDFTNHQLNVVQANPAVAVNASGTFAIAADDASLTNSASAFDPFAQTFKQLARSYFAVANGNQIEVRRLADNSLIGSFTPKVLGLPLPPGGVSLAFGDTGGSGYDNLIVGSLGSTSPQGGPVLIYSGALFATGQGFVDPGMGADVWYPYTGVGSYVAAADFNDDGVADIITGAAAGNPHVKIWSGAVTGLFQRNLLASFFAYGINYNIGVRVAAGDLNGDGVPDLVTGAAAGNPHVHIFDGKTLINGPFTFDPITNPTADQLGNPGFFAYGINYNIGVAVAVADVYGDGGDLVVGAAAGNPQVRVYRNADIRNPNFNPQSPADPPANSFFANTVNQNIGATVAAGDFEGSGAASDILVGVTNGPTTWRVFGGRTSDGLTPPAPLVVNGITFQGDFPGTLGTLEVAA